MPKATERVRERKDNRGSQDHLEIRKQKQIYRGSLLGVCEASIVAIVPVRAGSQRVPRKGFRPFGDTTLVDLKLSTLAQVDKIDEVIVTTDSNEVLEIADKYGVTKHTREPYFAS